MELHFSPADEAFRAEIARWLVTHLQGEFETLRYSGGPGDEHRFPAERQKWEQTLASGGWTGLAWPREYGGRACSIEQQVIFYEEYARAGAPGRVGHIGEGLAGPTIIAFGTEDQKQRYLPGILQGTELWCQGYSEPDAGSDLANISTRARFHKATGRWHISGQKVWTSLAQEADYCFVIARTDPDSVAHQGLGFFLINMHQPGIAVRGIRQITGTCAFNEVFFDEAQCDANDIIGAPGDGWKVAMGLLGFERGISTLGQQMQFQNELKQIIRIARDNGAAQNPLLRQRIARAHSGLTLMRYNTLRILSGKVSGQAGAGPEALIYKLFWARWHRDLGELAIDVLGIDGQILEAWPYALSRLQAMYLFVRADTIYGGSNEIQKNIIAERGLGMPKEPRQPAVAVCRRPYREKPMDIHQPDYVPGHNLLKDKSVLITAAAGAGIGFATAKKCIEEGCGGIVISDIHGGRLDQAVAALQQNTGLCNVFGILCDVRIEDQVRTLIDFAEHKLGGVDILINNAGLGTTRSLIDMPDEEWNRVVDITLGGTMRMTRYMMKTMRARGQGGAIVNNASVLGWRGQKEQAHYAAAKAGVMALTRCAALEAAEFGVRINAVSPSLAMHAMLQKSAPAELLAELAAKEAYSRGAKTWEVANVMVFLASDYASYLTGESIACSSQQA